MNPLKEYVNIEKSNYTVYGKQCELLMKKYYIDYKDKTNFIYLGLSKRKINDIIQNRDYNTIFSLYGLYAYCKVITCNNKKITSFPYYPNLEILDLSNNRLSSVPPMKKLKVLIIKNNKLENLYYQPGLEIINCSGNKNIKKLPEFKNIKYIKCDKNIDIDITNKLNIKQIEINKSYRL